MNQAGMRPTPPHRAGPIRRDILFDESRPIRAPLTRLDIESLRRSFAALGDRAAQAVIAAGFDQDDVVLDRLMRCHVDDTVGAELPADWLADAGRLSGAIIAALSSRAQRPIPIEGVTIESVRVRAVLERWA